MRVAIALLVNDDLCNRLAQVTLRCRNYGFGLRVLRLPAHVSLKQPFVVPEFDRFETFFDRLATQIEPQSIELDGLQFYGSAEQGVVELRVVADSRLREIHMQLNADLETEFGGTQADFDGDEYVFHLTVAIGRCSGESLPQLHAEIASFRFKEKTVATKLAMFIYEEAVRPDNLYGMREYGTYKVLPLRQDT